MHFVLKLILSELFVIVLLVYLIYKVVTYFRAPPVPRFKNTWWGPGCASEKEDTSVKPFKINVAKEVIDDLKRRLINTRTLTSSLEGTQEQHECHSTTLKPLLDYWSSKYDWPSREKFLNQFPQYETNIQGLNIHFIHVKPKAPPGIILLPLLILHGWPSSTREFYKIIPILTAVHEKCDFSFEIVAPSLPGFIFSDGARKPEFGPTKMSVVLKNLMLRLGHRQFYVHGGDWGGVIITQMATLFPQHVSGLHTHMPIALGKFSLFRMLFGSLWPSLAVGKDYVNRVYPLKRILKEILLGSGFFHIQALKPEILGIGMNDSPAGLAAYILENFTTNIDKYNYDDLIDNLMLYWLSKCFTTSLRIYKEGLSKLEFLLYNIPIAMDVPCAVARFSGEMIYFTDTILKDKYPNLVHSSDFTESGHFAALEQPELLAEDIFMAVNEMRKLKK